MTREKVTKDLSPGKRAKRKHSSLPAEQCVMKKRFRSCAPVSPASAV